MPLQDKSRSDRKVKARKVVAYDSGGNPLILDSVTDMAEQLGIATQTAYNIIRRGQVYDGKRYVYEQEGGVTDYGGKKESGRDSD